MISLRVAVATARAAEIDFLGPFAPVVGQPVTAVVVGQKPLLESSPAVAETKTEFSIL